MQTSRKLQRGHLVLKRQCKENALSQLINTNSMDYVDKSVDGTCPEGPVTGLPKYFVLNISRLHPQVQTGALTS